jgi:hypothetical protein
MQNRGMLLAPNTLLFRVHTRVLVTLSVALLIAVLGVTGHSMTAPSALPALQEKNCVERSSLPLDQARSGLPRTLVRIFFLLPHLIPHDR